MAMNQSTNKEAASNASIKTKGKSKSKSVRRELWLVTTSTKNQNANDDDDDTTQTETGTETSKTRITSLDELKEAISCLEQSQPQPQPQPQSPSLNRISTANVPRHSHSHSEETAVSNRVFLDEVKRFELFRSVIQHEDDLLNQRVSWIILAQSFLMAAFITASSDPDDDTYSLKYITAAVGILTVIVTMPAILAAGRNIELQQRVYFAHIGSEERCIELHGHGRDYHSKMSRARRREEHAVRMREGHIFPNMAFRGGGAVPIVFTVVALAVVQVVGWILLLIAMGMEW